MTKNMSLLQDSVGACLGQNNDFIILCDEKKIVKTKTFEEILQLNKLIICELSKHFSEMSECVGLLMAHNLYLPSIIIRYIFNNYN